MEDKKKIAAMLVMGLKPKSPMDKGMDSEKGSMDPSEQDSSESDEPDTMTAGKEVMDSMKMGDVKGFVDSLKSFIKLCDYDEPEGAEEGE